MREEGESQQSERRCSAGNLCRGKKANHWWVSFEVDCLNTALSRNGTQGQHACERAIIGSSQMSFSSTSSSSSFLCIIANNAWCEVGVCSETQQQRSIQGHSNLMSLTCSSNHRNLVPLSSSCCYQMLEANKHMSSQYPAGEKQSGIQLPSNSREDCSSCEWEETRQAALSCVMGSLS